MAHNAGVVRQANVLTLVMDAISPYRAFGTGVIVDDKGTLDIDLDRSWVGNGLLKPRGSGGICVLGGHGAIATGLESKLRKNWRRRASTSTGARNKIIKEGAQLMFPFHVNVGGMEVPVMVRTAYISFCPEFVEKLGWNQTEQAEDKLWSNQRAAL